MAYDTNAENNIIGIFNLVKCFQAAGFFIEKN